MIQIRLFKENRSFSLENWEFESMDKSLIYSQAFTFLTKWMIRSHTLICYCPYELIWICLLCNKKKTVEQGINFIKINRFALLLNIPSAQITSVWNPIMSTSSLQACHTSSTCLDPIFSNSLDRLIEWILNYHFLNKQKDSRFVSNLTLPGLFISKVVYQ